MSAAAATLLLVRMSGQAAWGAGALVVRLRTAHPDDKPDLCWPPAMVAWTQMNDEIHAAKQRQQRAIETRERRDQARADKAQQEANEAWPRTRRACDLPSLFEEVSVLHARGAHRLAGQATQAPIDMGLEGQRIRLHPALADGAHEVQSTTG